MPDERVADVLERVWKGDAEGEAFHGPAWRATLSRVDASAAARRPIAGAHSIHEIAAHVLAWREVVLARVEGGAGVPPEDDGWTRVVGPDPAAWKALRERLDAAEDRILAALRAGRGGDSRSRDLLRFLLHHDLHHGGQVALLASPAIRGA
jgi:uncharacterized damage-inducible protein DinB